MLIDNRPLNFDYNRLVFAQTWKKKVSETFTWSMALISPSFCYATLSSVTVLYSKDNTFQLKMAPLLKTSLHPLCWKKIDFPIGILGQVWYLIVLIPALCTLTYFANWQSRQLNSLSAIVVVRLCDLIQKVSKVCMTWPPLCKIRPVVNHQ